MATLIGTVVQVIGEVFVVAPDGTQRLLAVGDRLFAGERIVTVNGAVGVELAQGGELTLGRGSDLLLTEQLLADAQGGPAPVSQVPPSAEVLADVEALQRAIAAGEDPTQTAPATAAGPAAGGGGDGGGGSSFVLLDETGGQVDPTIGFNTQGLDAEAAFPEPEPALADEEPVAEDGIPTAIDDLGLIDEDEPALEGNVLLNDIAGTDGGITVVTVGAFPGAFGELTLNPDGTYSYALNNSLPAVQALDDGETLTETFSYTIQDADGDPSTATLTIIITGSNDVPALAVTTDGVVEEAGLATGSAASSASEFASGTFTLSDPDGLDDLQTVTMNGKTVSIGSLVGEQFAGSYGTLTVTAYDAATGVASWVYELTGPSMDGPGIEGDTFTLTVSDGTVSSAPGQIVIEIIDDVPSISVTGQAPSLLVDETTLGTSASASFSSAFSAVFGADGSAGASGVSYSLAVVNGSASGLLDVATGNQVLLYKNATTGVVEGRLGGTEGAVAFTVSVNSAGVVTLTQSLALRHPDNASDNEQVTVTANAIQLVATATDGDGDTASTSLNLDGALSFADDGPSADASGASVGTLTLDESAASADGIASASLTATVVQGLFTTPSTGTDGGVVSYSLQLTGTDVGSGLYALDPSDKLSDTDGYGQGAEILLNQSGNTITGSLDGTDYFTLSIDPSSGAVTFTQLTNIWHPTPGSSHDEAATLNLASADLLKLIQTVTDNDGDTASAAVNLGQGVFTIEDDGPSASTSGALVGTLTLDESADGPASASLTATVVQGLFATPSTGTDGGVVSYSLQLTGTDVGSGLYALDSGDKSAADSDGFGQGAEVLLNQSGNTITGSLDGTDYFTLSIDPSSGAVTFTQLANIWHPTPGSSHDEAATLNLASADLLKLIQTVTDNDGDTARASVDLGRGVFTIEDDGPMASTSGALVGTLTLDESADGIASASLTATAVQGLFATPTTGTDGGVVSYSLQLTGTDVGSGLYALDPSDKLSDTDGYGQGAEILLNQSGNTVIGSVGGTDYFTLSIDPSSGAVTFTQLANIWHPTPGSSYDEAAVLNLASADLLKLIQTVTDNDGDIASAAVNLGQGVFTIEDDGPSASTSGALVGTLTLDESADGPVSASLAATVVQGLFATPSTGTDGGVVSYSLQLTGTDVGSGLYALDPSDKLSDTDGYGQGAEILLNQSGNTITGSVGGTDYFTLSIDPSNGAVTFTQLTNIWHPTPGSSYDEAATLNLASADLLKLIQTVTDNDGDTASAVVNLGQGVFTIEDDGPSASTSGASIGTLSLDESADGPASASLTATVVQGLFATPSTGTDGGVVSYSLQLTGTNVGSGLYALDSSDKSAADSDGFGQGAEILLNQSGHTITGSVGGTDYFTLSIDPSSGAVTFTQLTNIWHPTPGSSHDEAATLNLASADLLKLIQTVTDNDGDTASAAVNLGQGVFTIEDDGPMASTSGASVGTLTLDESADGPVSASLAATVVQGLFATPSTGTDGGVVSYSLQLTGTDVGSGLYALDPSDKLSDTDGYGQGAEILLNQSGNTITGSLDGTDYFTLSIDPSSGAVTFTQLTNIWHPTPGSSYDEAATLNLASADLLKLIQTVTDNDGDTASAVVNLGQGVFTIEDDGPSASTSGASIGTLSLDESADGPASASLTATVVQGLFAAPSTGTDGGVVSYSLQLIGTNVGSGLYALDPSDKLSDTDGYGQGAEILLNQSGNTVTGSLDGTDYFTLSIDPSSGAVTFTQLTNLWHPTPGSSHDEAATLNLASADLLKLIQTVTDNDGDTASAAVNLGQGVFTIEDDGPMASTSGASVGTLTLDESADGLASASLTATAVQGLFTSPSTGTDGGVVSYSLQLTGTDVGSGLYALDPSDKLSDTDGYGQGAEILLNQSGNTVTGSLDGTDYFTLSIDPSSGAVTFTQLTNIWHPTPGSSYDEAAVLNLASADLLKLIQTVTDNDGDTASASVDLGRGVFTIEDDGPMANTSGASVGTLTLDESAASAGGLASASLTATAVQGLFATPSTGTDGGVVSYSLQLTGTDVGSGLYALDPSDKLSDTDGYGQGAEILLNQSGNTVTGSLDGTDYFTLSIDPSSGAVTFTQLTNIWHPTPGSSYDEAAVLNLASADLLRLIQTVTDNDGDTASAVVNLGQGVFTIEDDGPSASTSGALVGTLTLDESADGIASASLTATAVQGLFATPSTGTDGGVVSYSLQLTGTNVGSGLYALDSGDKSAVDSDGFGQGAEILLNQSGNTITGSLDGTDFFTLSIDPSSGAVTFTQLTNIWHPTPGSSHDEAAVLNLASADLLKLIQTVTDNDGDIATAAVNLGQGVFTIEDDGPSASTSGALVGTLTLDESADGLASASLTATAVQGLFATPSTGTDGGVVSYSLQLTGTNVGSGLYALDPSDKLSDTDGYGQGAEILLNQSGNTITGSVGGTDYFTLSIDPNSGAVTFTQLTNIWHPTPGSSYDEAAVLNLASADLLKLIQTVTDNDGDTASAAVNLGQGVFTIEDDGPTLTVDAVMNAAASLQVALDETVGAADRYAPGEASDTYVNDDAGAALAQVTTSVTGGLTSLFTLAGGYGTDGAGSQSGVLSFAGIPSQGLLTNLTATNGGAITLYLDNGVVNGLDTDGHTVFSIAIVDVAGQAQLQTTLYEALNHGADSPSLFDETAQLLLGEGSQLGLQYEVTRTDADGDQIVESAQVTLADHNTSVFSFDDDGPVFSSVEDVELSSLAPSSISGTYSADFGSDGLDYLSVALGNSGIFEGKSVSFSQHAPQDGIIKVDAISGSEVLFSFYYAVDTDAVAQGGEGGATLEAFTNPVDPQASAFFTLTVNPNETYSFELHSSSVLSTSTVSGEDFSAFGPTGSVSTSDGSLTISGGDADSLEQVNASNNGIGVKTPTIEADQWLYFSFQSSQTKVSFNLQQWSGSGTAALLISVGGVAFDFDKNDADIDLLSLSKPSSGGDATIAIQTVTNASLIGTYEQVGDEYTLYVGSSFDNVRLDHDGGSLKFNVNDITYDEEITVSDLTLDFQLAVTDLDGDVAYLADPLTVTLDDDIAPAMMVQGESEEGSPMLASSLVDASDSEQGEEGEETQAEEFSLKALVEEEAEVALFDEQALDGDSDDLLASQDPGEMEPQPGLAELVASEPAAADELEGLLQGIASVDSEPQLSGADDPLLESDALPEVDAMPIAVEEGFAGTGESEAMLAMLGDEQAQNG